MVTLPMSWPSSHRQMVLDHVVGPFCLDGHITPAKSDRFGDDFMGRYVENYEKSGDDVACVRNTGKKVPPRVVTA